MCGRYENKLTFESVIQYFIEQGITLEDLISGNDKDKIDIRPTSSVISVVKSGNKYSLCETNWGIKFSDKSPLIFNSRIETITTKPFWKSSFGKNRVLIPMSAFYEWQVIDNKKVQSRIYLDDEDFFFVPAIYFEKDKKIFTSFVTVPPNKFMSSIHHRMPAILTKKNAVNIFTADTEEAIKMCKPYEGKMSVKRFK